MASYPNQTIINIGAIESPLLHLKDEKKQNGEAKQFLLALNWDELLNVMIDLEPPEFMLWQYLSKWGGQGYYNFSPADLETNFGWSENSIRKYKDGLEKKGYLIKVSRTQYTFNPYPEIVEMRAAANREKNRMKREARKK